MQFPHLTAETERFLRQACHAKLLWLSNQVPVNATKIQRVTATATVIFRDGTEIEISEEAWM